jgi:hypothetical protein
MNTEILNIHSKFGFNKKSISNFRFNFNEIKNIVELKLISIEIPKTIYQFTNKRDNNKFKITVNSIEYNFILPEGNHSTISLIVEIKNFFTNNSIPVDITFNINTLKVKIISLSPLPFTINFKNNTLYTQLGIILGFEEDIYENVTEIENNGSITLDIDKYFLLYLNGLGYLNFNNRTYFTKIVLEKKVFDIIYLEQGNENRLYKFNQPVDLNYFDVILDDEFGHNLDLNGIELSLSIEVKFINNSYLKNFYDNFQYNEGLSKIMLHDQMLKYYFNKSKDIKIEENKDILISMVEQPGAILLKMLLEYKDKFDKSLEEKDKPLKIVKDNIENELLSPNKLAIEKYKKDIINKKNKINEINEIKKKIKY